jgi:transposase
MQMEVTMNSLIHIGIDVHKDTYSLCSYSFQTSQAFGQTKIGSDNKLVIKYVEKLMKRHPEVEVLCGYEAGPTGFGLYRDLHKANIPCVVMAPTSLPRAVGNRVKTDRLDALELAKHLAYGTYSAVRVPTSEDEAVKDFTRLRNTRQQALKRAKQNLLSFLLRRQRRYTEGSSYWTLTHHRWLKQQQFTDPLDQETYNEYLQELYDQEEKVARYDARIEELSRLDAYRERVEKLRCFKGIDTHTALSLVCEIGDFSRFATAAQFSAYLGLVPREDSSGQRERRGGITKGGNIRLRMLLIEGANAATRGNLYGAKSKKLKARQAGNTAQVIAYADRAQRRLHRTYNKLVLNSVPRNKAIVAVARELSCFIWGMMNDCID